jgi:rubredoxin
VRVLTAPRGGPAPMTTRNDTDEARALGGATRMECKVCWYVYDPAAGDPVWQVPPGTPWIELPPHWSCPNCSTPQDGFLVLRDD